jgi:hypothetical protein
MQEGEAMTPIPTERLRRIREFHCETTEEVEAMATELLAARDALAALHSLIRKSHNGYDPEVRKEMAPHLKEPATELDALRELITEQDGLYGAERAAFHDALVALTKERDEAHAFINREGYRHCDVPACNCGSWHPSEGWYARCNELRERVTDWRDAFAMPDEPDAEAIERTRAALAATEGEQGGGR